MSLLYILRGVKNCESRSNTQHGTKITIYGRVGYKAALSVMLFTLGIAPAAFAENLKSPFLAEAVAKYGSEEAAGKAILDLGWNNLNQGDWEIARKRFEEARQLIPNDANVLWGLGAASAFQQRWNEAIDFFKAGLEKNPGHANLLADLSWAYEEKGMLDEAVVWNQKAAAAYAKITPPDPRRWKPSYNFGLIYAKKGQLENAISSLNETLQINPGLGDAYGLLAIVYYERRQYDLAAQNAAKAEEFGFRLDEEFLETLKAYQ